MGTYEGRFESRGAKVACERLYTPQGVEMDICMDIYGLYKPNDQGRFLSKSAEQRSEPGCGLKTVTLPFT